MPSLTNAELEAKLTAMLAGVQSGLPPASTLMVNGVQTTQPGLVATLQGQLALFDGVAKARAALTAAVAALHAGMPQGKAFMKELTSAVQQLFGRTNPQLAQFGIDLPKPKTPLTPGKKAVANVRRANTRAARGIMGKNQRAAIQPNAIPTRVTLDANGVPVADSPAEPPPVAAGPSTADK